MRRGDARPPRPLARPRGDLGRPDRGSRPRQRAAGLVASGAAPSRRGRVLAPLLRPARRTHLSPRSSDPLRTPAPGANRTPPPGPSRHSTNRNSPATWRSGAPPTRSPTPTCDRPARTRRTFRDGYQQHRLDRRVSDAGAMPAKANARIAQLGEALHPGITADPHWPAWPSSSTSPTGRACAPATCTASPPRGRCRSINPRPRWRTGSSTPSVIGTPATSTTPASARSTAGKDAPLAPTIRRPYEPPPLPSPAPQPDYSRSFGSQPRPGPRR